MSPVEAEGMFTGVVGGLDAGRHADVLQAAGDARMR